jgi:SulP family sulfate permease
LTKLQKRGRGNKEAIAQGVANILSGVFSGMGGCAMLGQSLINVSNGARQDFQVVAAIALCFCHVWCWSNRSFTNGCLTGLMIMVAIELSDGLV